MLKCMFIHIRVYLYTQTHLIDIHIHIGMAHLDLRPANIFIKNEKGNNFNLKTSKILRELLVEEIYVLKLGDLGQVYIYIYIHIYIYVYTY
jgi:hypothetical protein